MRTLRKNKCTNILRTSDFITKKMSFDASHNLANNFFQAFVTDERSFTHNVGKTEDGVCKANLHKDRIDFHKELRNLNFLCKEWEVAHSWSEFTTFQITQAEPWSDFDNVVIFTSKCINLEEFFQDE